MFHSRPVCFVIANILSLTAAIMQIGGKQVLELALVVELQGGTVSAIAGVAGVAG